MPKRQRTFNSKTFADVVQQAGREIASALERATTVTDHEPSSGGIRETGPRDFLRQLLPTSYYVGTGFVFDALDTKSRQLDIIIAREPPLAGVYEKDNLCFLPCEVVLAAIEVKKTLNAKEVRRSLANAASVRSLKPYGKQEFGSARMRGEDLPPKIHRCFYSVIAYDSNLATDGWAEREWGRLKKLAMEASSAPDIFDRIAILDRGLMNTAHQVATNRSAAMEEIALNWFIHLSNHLDRESKRRPAFDPDIYTTPGSWTPLE